MTTSGPTYSIVSCDVLFVLTQLTVLGIDSHDPRCRETLREMAINNIDLYEVDNWNDLDHFTSRIEEKECQPLS